VACVSSVRVWVVDSPTQHAARESSSADQGEGWMSFLRLAGIIELFYLLLFCRMG
jgi:hypothetical protein